MASCTPNLKEALIEAVASPPIGGTDDLVALLPRCSDKLKRWRHVMSRAASCGNLACVRILDENGFKWTYHAMHAAAAHGHFECFKLLRERKNYPLDQECLAEAVTGGNLECVQYVVEGGGLSFDADRVFDMAAEDHYDMLVYAHARRGAHLTDDIPLVTTDVRILELWHENKAHRWMEVYHDAPRPLALVRKTLDNFFTRHRYNYRGKTRKVEECIRFMHRILRHKFDDAQRRILARDILWRRVRAILKTRAIVWYWYDKVGRKVYAPGGVGVKRDREAYEAENLFA